MTNRLFTILGLLALATGCTFTTTREKPPVFSGSTDSLGARLNQLVKCEHFNVDGQEKTTNGKKVSYLQVDVINGVNIPQGESMIALARSIGQEVRNALKDTGQYDRYSVRFVMVKVDGGLTSRSWTAKEFESAELR